MEKPWKVTWLYKGEERVTYRKGESETDARNDCEEKIARHKGKIVKIERVDEI